MVDGLGTAGRYYCLAEWACRRNNLPCVRDRDSWLYGGGLFETRVETILDEEKAGARFDLILRGVSVPLEQRSKMAEFTG